MESNNDGMVGTPHYNSSLKVHSSMCSQLTIMLDKVTSILPSIEAAQPGCKAGIEELCNLYSTVDKGKLVIQNCIECSSLYLAITGEATAMRCERIKNSMRRSLFLIQNMIPALLANQIVDIHDDLGDMRFHVDPEEEEAGKAILKMLRQSDATQELERQTFLLACSKLNLTTPKDILVERRAIKKLLNKINGNDPKKEGILNFFMYLVRKYGKDIKPETGAKNEMVNTASRLICTPSTASDNSTLNSTPDTNSKTRRYEDRNNFSGVATPPTELCCPISMKLMCDPVIIASGQTYERENIKRWFSKGYDTCPRTQVKLENFTITPNTCMQAVIYNWCKDHKLECTYLPEQFQDYSLPSLHDISAPLIADRNRDYMFEHSNSSFSLSGASYLSSPVRETDVSKTSFTHSVSSLHDISVPLIADRNIDYMVDHSSSSFGPSGPSYSSSPLRETGVSKTSFSQLYSNANCQLYLSFCIFDKEMFLNFFHELSVLSVELQRKAMKDLKNVLNGENQVWQYMLSNGFLEAFLQFVKNDNLGYTLQAQKTGIQFFLTFLCCSRTRSLSISEDAVRLFVSLLDSELKLEALLILHELLHQPSCRESPHIASVVAPSVIEALDTGDTECLELALQIICELSSSNHIKPLLISSEMIKKLSTMLSEVSLTEYCLKILRNLCKVKQAADLIIRSDDCLSSISDHLDTGSREEQEHASVILNTVLCSRSAEGRVLVTKEGVIPALVDLSVNGNEVAKASSARLLQLLTESRVAHAADGAVESSPNGPICKQQISKSDRYIPRKLNIFSRSRSPFAGPRLRTL